MTSSAP